MIPIVLGLVLVAVATVAYIALRNAQDFSDANQIIPGTPTTAPKAWAGAHSTEARLHRRLRDSMEVLRVNASLDDGSLSDVRSQLEALALRTDERLVVIAGLPKARRTAPLQEIESSVGTIEDTVASLVALRGPTGGDLTQGIDDIRTRVRLISEARSELAALDPTASDLSALRDHLEAEPRPDTDPPSTPPSTSPS